MRVAKRLIVSGRVQGVGFRYFSQETAQRFGIKGWVRNLSDGTVELHVEGTANEVDAFQQALKDGNRFVGVERIEETEANDQEFRSFDIRY
ncbi:MULTISPECIES: acylphosphatase [Exiguobacterium]|uniref:Acylphosphatase n=1 Tax=Exiguobacterium profundum TaxID=307643 RepID=A0ABY8B244_9BACL|nr:MULTISPECIES: acylphosphatase [Exiguobacterium]WED56199.1 acylphosphatase [Exiguobacterium profundum]